MKISSRFSIAVHIVLTIAILGSKQKTTSDFLASCISVNPVVIRRILGQLKKADLVDVKAGEGGAFLIKNASTLTLFDIYQAVEVVEDISLFNSHKQPELKCPVDCSSCPRLTGSESEECLAQESCDDSSGESCCYIHNNIENHLFSAQKAMEDSLKETTIQKMILELSAL
ncbi:Rrf2 family transcriptional regulator [Methanimicrococcus blatticola]|uniref:DNA-binding IscR family transcriptional regulator n=1 Tax=Methanimicrococcus blatticola TaxID=91560 RepID=A0A484F3T7_9EURY|nr:Rrf2 family transcriptional regulator [Methanimicrococcus blatticola]MBZ3936072.1 Rrf2 family transcriptional regulator [Methanimicrococcus blatticola]MCC2509317.1 Rrf2 family transcriptional regulator [Methanimicrococcus blatticola]TDQ68202.1 DNA-binding IscR family transcriptional regulator [Methanimicrococcus blatticola]